MSQATLAPAVTISHPAKYPCELELRAVAALRRSGHRMLHEAGCTCSDDTIVLTGVVPSFHMKQLAQEAVRNVEGVRRIDNRLAVEYFG
jgi:osmotically-inducible protein OsmY